jgi:hypothetical protein
MAEMPTKQYQQQGQQGQKRVNPTRRPNANTRMFAKLSAKQLRDLDALYNPVVDDSVDYQFKPITLSASLAVYNPAPWDCFDSDYEAGHDGQTSFENLNNKPVLWRQVQHINEF